MYSSPSDRCYLIVIYHLIFWSSLYNIDFYKPTYLGLLYYILYYFPEWITISPRSLKESDLLKILLTDTIGIRTALDKLSKENLVEYESYADVQKYVINLKTMSELNESF